ncbi:hypothetical protein TREES_T100008390 [Tupaia chinensis]|uniref:Uncharacterized protein n=1 Tax=Tupaia chinensis TaxID=246437 RepID=L9LAC2_TUPCH|nr:hypothetical protein TREES_T100008390 [Tupaia chinensis]
MRATPHLNRALFQQVLGSAAEGPRMHKHSIPEGLCELEEDKRSQAPPTQPSISQRAAARSRPASPVLAQHAHAWLCPPTGQEPLEGRPDWTLKLGLLSTRACSLHKFLRPSCFVTTWHTHQTYTPASTPAYLTLPVTGSCWGLCFLTGEQVKGRSWEEEGALYFVMLNPQCMACVLGFINDTPWQLKPIPLVKDHTTPG